MAIFVMVYILITYFDLSIEGSDVFCWVWAGEYLRADVFGFFGRRILL